MKSMKTSRLIPAALAVGILGAATSHAYVDIELDGNHHVIGESYSAAGGKVIVYRPSGAIEVDRAAIRSIQERSGAMPAEVHSVSSGTATSSRGASSSGDASLGAVSAGSGATTQTSVKDPKARDEQLARELIQMRLNRLAAKQRGDDETIKALDKEIKTRQSERESIWKKQEPSSGDVGSAD
jgi:hypothetical protein